MRRLLARLLAFGGLTSFVGCFSQLLDDCPEDTIDESAGILTAVSFGNVDRFVNDCLDRYPLIIKQQFEDSKTKQIFVDRWHLDERPGRRRLGDLSIEFLAISQDTFDQMSRENSHARIHFVVVVVVQHAIQYV